MNNPLQFVQIMRNPQMFLQQAMQNNQIMQNPMARNAIEMMQKGDRKGTEEMARNMLKERGMNPDEVYKQFQSMVNQ